MLLTVSMTLAVLRAAEAGNYLVCYLPPDTQKRLIRFCPGPSDAAAGQACACLLRSDTLAGTMTRLTLSDTGITGTAAQAMCLPQDQAGAAVTLCTTFRAEGEDGCVCNGEDGGHRGATYTVTMIPRIPLRTNQAAAADFLRRLQECCVSK
jgi:hypothetical protein